MSGTGPTINYSIDASQFSRFHSRTDAPVWWGIVGLIMIEMSVVVAFVISYLYLLLMSSQWPPVAHEVSSLTLPTATLVLLLISCFTMYMAGKEINRDHVRAFVLYTAASVLLACICLVLRWLQFEQFDFRWDSHVYGSLMWTISGFHFIHVVSAAIGTAVVAILGCYGFFNRNQKIAVVVDTLYWNFVAIAWIPFYIILYWVPRFTQAAGVE
jgi:cytochrome c oxidase subunit III